MDARQRQDLDRYITGNYGENQFKNEPKPTNHKRIMRITSHAGHARYLATLSEPVGEIARDRSIPSPYAYSTVHVVYTDERGRQVFIVETLHKRYDVFDCSGEQIQPLEN